MVNIWKESVSFEFIAIDVILLVMSMFLSLTFMGLWSCTYKMNHVTRSRKYFVVWFSIIFFIQNTTYMTINFLSQIITCYVLSAMFYPMSYIKDWMLALYLFEMYFLYIKKHEIRRNRDIDVYKKSNLYQMYKFVVERISFSGSYMVTLICIFILVVVFQAFLWVFARIKCVDDSTIFWVQIATKITTNISIFSLVLLVQIVIVIQFLKKLKRESCSICSSLKTVLVDKDPYMFKMELLFSYSVYLICSSAFMMAELFVFPHVIATLDSIYWNMIIYTIVSSFHQFFPMVCFLSFPIIIDGFVFTRNIWYHRIFKKKKTEMDQIKNIIFSDPNSQKFKLFESYCMSTFTEENIDYLKKVVLLDV